MKEIIPLQFDNELQLQLFFTLLNTAKGCSIYELINRIGYTKKTTIIDNLTKLRKRLLPIEHYKMFYVGKYPNYSNKRGRPITIFYVPRHIRNYLSQTYVQMELV